MKRLTLTLALIAIASANAADTTSDYTLSVEAGAEYDSTLTVADVDETLNESDTATLVKAKAGGKWTTGNTEMSASYSVSNKDYANSDNFDLTLQQTSADINHDFASTPFRSPANRSM